MTENDENRVRTTDVDAELQMGSAERSQNRISMRIAIEIMRRQAVSKPLMALYYLEEPVGIFTGACQGPQGAPRSSEVASCKERPTSSDKELLVRWMPLLRHEEEVATKDKDRTGKDGLASHGMARTILRLLGGNNARPEGADDEQ